MNKRCADDTDKTSLKADKEFEWKGAVVGREEKSLNQPICINNSVSQSIDQSINRSTNQSILYVETGGDIIC